MSRGRRRRSGPHPRRRSRISDVRAAPRTIRRALSLAATSALVVAHGCGGGDTDPPVIWAASIDGPAVAAPGSLVSVRVDAKPTGAWYFYSSTQPAGGPIPARIWLADSTTFRPEGPMSSSRPTISFDSIFGINVEKYSAAVSFRLPVRVAPEASAGVREIRVNAQYQACNDTVCLSPRTVTMMVPLTIQPR